MNTSTENIVLSIILPYFNAEKTLHRAIESILNQTYSAFELILVDNNSTDQSTAIATSLSSQDQRIKLLSESKQGVVFAANHGLAHAKGAYIARMDADDEADLTKLEKQVTFLDTHSKVDIVTTQVQYKSNTPEETGFNHFIEWSNQQCSHQEIFNSRFVEFPVVNPTLMIRKNVFDSVGGYREGDFPEDYDWFLSAMQAGIKIKKIEEQLIDWHDSNTRLTRSDSRYRTDAFFQLKTDYIASFLKELLGKNPSVWIWGAGKLGLLRSQWLFNKGIQIEGYIDIKKGKKLQDYECIHFEEISLNNQPFIVSYISNRGRREEIRSFLNARGYTEGINYLIAG